MSLVWVAISLASANPSVVVPLDTGEARPEARLTVSNSQLLEIARTAGRRGDHATAAAALQALAHDPNVSIRNEARFELALMAVARGQKTAAATWLRLIVDEQPRAQRARLELAKVLVALGDMPAAQRELRALQASGLPPDVAKLVDRYSQRLRAMQPMGASIEIALAPDSNITRSTHSDTLGTILGDFVITEDSQARSGLGVAIAGQAYRRFSVRGGDPHLLVRGRAGGNFYRETRFNDIALEVVAGPEIVIGRNRFSVEAGPSQHWFGQKPFMRSARVSGSWTRPWGRRTQARVAATAALIDNQMNDLQDGRFYSVDLGLERALSQASGIALSLAGERQSLQDAAYSTRGWRAGVLGWRDLGRLTVSGGFTVGLLEADERLLLFPLKRHDRFRRVSIGATFRQVSVGGFSPLVRFSIERNQSTVELYDYRRRRTELAIVRSF